jgi:uncharacterized protein (UPF0332 family)
VTLQRQDAVRKEIERGEKALKAAQLLSENGLYEDAVSRAYYAVLHFAKAALLSQGVRTSSHIRCVGHVWPSSCRNRIDGS